MLAVATVVARLLHPLHKVHEIQSSHHFIVTRTSQGIKNLSGSLLVTWHNWCNMTQTQCSYGRLYHTQHTSWQILWASKSYVCKAHGLTRSHQINAFYGLNLFFCKKVGCNGIWKNILLGNKGLYNWRYLCRLR